MLHVATIHFRAPQWIPIQVRELRRHMKFPFRTWASLEGIDRSYEVYFDHILDQRGTHAGKLNHLAIEIAQAASPDDLIMFLDGDAFPITDPSPLISSALSTAPLLAVQRLENATDTQPHPSFCVTHVRTWQALRGDWSPGFTWRGPDGELVSDVGGNLLRQLTLAETSWVRVKRTNRHNPHPVFFGVYGDVIYHHGAGFRKPVSRADLAKVGNRRRHNPISQRVIGTAQRARLRQLAYRNRRMSKALFRRIEQDDPTWLTELK